MILKNIERKTTRYLSGIVNSKGNYIVWSGSGSRKLIVIWYGALKPNPIDSAQPKLAVLLGELNDDTLELTGNRYCLFFNANLLGIVRIGTIWELNSYGKAELLFAANYDKETFKVDCRVGCYEILSLKDLDCLSVSKNSAFPILGLWSNYFADSKVIKFKTTTGQTVLVPCLEWFTRTYGASASMRRILITEPLELAWDKLYAPDKPYSVKSSDWHVRINKRLTIGDACFLAHLRYKKDVRKKVNRILANMMTSDNKEKIFVPVEPWNDSVCKINTKGVMLDDNETFLVLNINGFENPDCPKIHLDKGSTYNEIDDSLDPVPVKLRGEDEDGDEGNEQEGGLDENQSEIAQEGKPGRKATSRRVFDDEMEIFNPPKIKKIWTRNEVPPRGEPTLEGEGNPGLDDEPGEHSLSDPEGNNERLGKLNLTTPSVVKGQGILRSMWVTFLLFQERYPNVLHSVECYSVSSGFITASLESRLNLVLFPDLDNTADDDIHNWLKKPEPSRNRGCFVVRLGVASGYVYVLEIERTRHKSKEGHWSESNFKGLVFTLENDDVFEESLMMILNSVLENGGFFTKNVMFEGLGHMDVFVHRKDKNSKEEAYFPIVKNILRKVNIDPPK